MYKKHRLPVLLLAVLFVLFGLVFAQKASATEVSVQCPSFSLNTLDGAVVNQNTAPGKTKLIIFYRTTCGNSINSVSNVAKSDWVDNPDLSIIAACIDGGTPEEEIQHFMESYADGGKHFTSCVDAGDVVWDMLRAAGYCGSVSLPVSVVVDANGMIRNCLTGSTSEITYRDALAPYISGIRAPSRVNLSISGNCDYAEAYEVLEILNQRRVENGLSPLSMDKDLLAAAMQRAAECQVYYSHTRPNGKACFTVPDFGGNYQAENIAAGYTDAESVMVGWMNSPGHKANILTEEFTSAGIGVFYQEGYIYWVQLFSDKTAVASGASGCVAVTTAVEACEELLDLFCIPETISMALGKTEKISTNGINQGFFDNFVLDTSCLTFTSSNTAVATVSKDGVVKSVGCGTATITVKVVGGTQSVSIPVTVYEQGKPMLVCVDGLWKCMLDGELYTENTLVKHNGNWYHVKDGYWVRDTGFVSYNGKSYYVVNGVWNRATTLVKLSNGSWVYVKDGVYTKDTTLVKYNGGWYYVKNGKWVKTTGFVSYSGKSYYVVNGVWNKTTTLVKISNGSYVYVKNGVYTKETTLVKYNGNWLYVKNGTYTKTTAFVKYNGSTYYVVNGVWSRGTTGLIQISDGSWICVKNGVQDMSNTLVKHNGNWYHCNGGKWVRDTALVSYNGNLYYVRKGVVDFAFTGKLSYGGKVYNVVKGVVK